MFHALNSYFLAQDKCPVVLNNFFTNSCSQLWLGFVHHQASIFHETLSKIKLDHLNFCEVGETTVELK